MATAASPRRDAPRLRRSGAIRLLSPLAVVVGVPALLWLIFRPRYVNYDARYSMVWARDILRGHTPDYNGAFAPTPHPLQTVAGAFTLIFGDGSARAMVALTLLALGGLTWLVYRLGAELFSPAVGIVAAAVVATRPPLDRYAAIGYQDLGFALLVVLALLLEVRRPRRGLSVLAVLALAGLMRPDAWVLSALYVAYVWRESTPRTRAALLAVAAIGPMLWIAQDWIIAGAPLHSLQGTKKLAGEVNRRRSPLGVPFRMAWYLKLLLLWPLALGVPLGLVYAWRHERRKLLMPIAVALALTGFILLSALVGTSLISRYLITPAVILTLAYGLAVFGWRELAPGETRRRWQIAGMVALGLSIVWIPAQLNQLRGAKRKIHAEARNYTDLELAGKSPAVRARFERCGQMSALGHKAVPDLRYWLNGRPGSVTIVEGDVRKVGPLLLAPRATRQMWGLYRTTFAHIPPPPGYRALYRNHSWVVYAAPGCGTGRLEARPGGDTQTL